MIQGPRNIIGWSGRVKNQPTLADEDWPRMAYNHSASADTVCCIECCTALVVPVIVAFRALMKAPRDVVPFSV